MTVNERLLIAGLLPEWDQAVLKKDEKMLAELLELVDLTDQASAIVESALALRL
jgi:hypothetical protein